MAGQKKYSVREAVNTEATTTDIGALFYTTIRIQDGRCLESDSLVDL